jgi:hypothetical protein
MHDTLTQMLFRGHRLCDVSAKLGHCGPQLRLVDSTSTAGALARLIRPSKQWSSTGSTISECLVGSHDRGPWQLEGVFQRSSRASCLEATLSATCGKI